MLRRLVCRTTFHSISPRSQTQHPGSVGCLPACSPTTLVLSMSWYHLRIWSIFSPSLGHTLRVKGSWLLYRWYTASPVGLMFPSSLFPLWQWLTWVDVWGCFCHFRHWVCWQVRRYQAQSMLGRGVSEIQGFTPVALSYFRFCCSLWYDMVNMFFLVFLCHVDVGTSWLQIDHMEFPKTFLRCSKHFVNYIRDIILTGRNRGRRWKEAWRLTFQVQVRPR